MREIEGRIAVVTGGGSGMGRELVHQLATAGCHVATCDVDEESLADTKAYADASAPAGTVVTTFVADVSDESRLLAFRDFVADAHATDHINLLFNNAGVAGGGSFLLSKREEWDRTFAIDWGGVYICSRVFVPLLVASDAGHLINTSSVNGFWASLGPVSRTPRTAPRSSR